MKSILLILATLTLLSFGAVSDDFNWDSAAKGNKVPEPKDQGDCAGAGWAFATTTAIEANYKIKYNREITQSERELLNCIDDSCCPGKVSLAQAFNYVKAKNGLASDLSLAYDSGTSTCPRIKRRQGNIKSFNLIKAAFKNPTHDQNNTALITAIQKGPIAAGIIKP